PRRAPVPPPGYGRAATLDLAPRTAARRSTLRGRAGRRPSRSRLPRSSDAGRIDTDRRGPAIRREPRSRARSSAIRASRSPTSAALALRALRPRRPIPGRLGMDGAAAAPPPRMRAGTARARPPSNGNGPRRSRRPNAPARCARSSGTAAAPRSAPRRTAREMPGTPLPFEQHQLRAEAGTHRQQQAAVAGTRLAGSEEIREHEEHGSRREVPDVLQRVPAALHRGARNLQRLLACLEHLRPARVADEMSDVAPLQLLRCQEGIDVRAKLLADQLRDGGREHHLEPGIDHVPSHDALAVRVEDGARRGDARTAAARPAIQHRGGGAVAEQPAGDDVRNGEIFALQGERAELDGQEHGHFAGAAAKDVRDARKARRAGYAPEPEDRDALQVGAKAEAIDEPRIDRGRRDPG